jgi:outer membrane receptor protein involved in Fe transport
MRGRALLCRTALVLILIAAFSATTLLAQTGTATLRGTINDEAGNVFPGAEVTATSLERGYRATATAGGDGSYILAGIAPGRYRIDVTAPSYKGSTREVSLLVGQTLQMNFRLTPELVLMEQITVVGSTPVEMETHEVATNVTREQIELLPQNNRNFLNFVALAPGVIFQDTEFSKRFTSGAGALAHDHVNVVIDGASFKNDILQGGVIGQDSSRGNPFPQNAVQEFRVLTQNYSAEYGKASGAVITAVTKSGSNRMMGDVFGYFQDKSMVDPRNPLAATPGVKPEYERKQMGLSLGGPIVRDRMHYFLSYERNEEDRQSQVILGTVTGAAADAIRARYADRAGFYGVPFELNLLFGKVTFQPADQHLFDVNGFIRDETDIRGAGGQTSNDVSEEVVQNVHNIGGRYQFTTNTWLNELLVGYQYFEWNPRPLNADQTGLNYQGIVRVGGRDTEQNHNQTRYSIRDNLNLTSLEWFGSHNVKVGGSVDHMQYELMRKLFGNPLYSFRSAENWEFPFQAQYGVGNPFSTSDNTQVGVYIQDDWSVTDRLSLNLGVRWDYESDMFDTGFATPQSVRNQVAFLNLPQKYFTDGSQRDPIDDMFAPRLGATYDLLGNGKTVVFGGWGRFYDRIRYGRLDGERYRLQYATATFRFSRDGAPRDGQPTVVWDPRYFTVAGLQELMAIGTTGLPEIHLTPNDLNAPYTDQWNIGVRQALGNYIVSASYANHRGKDFVTTIRGNRRPDGTCCLAVPGASGVFLLTNDVKTWYDAVYVKVDRPFTGNSRWSASLAYTYADAEQIGGDAFSLDFPRVADYPRYPTAHVPDHTLVANALFRLPWEVTFGTLLRYNSGTKYNITDESRGTSADLRRVLRSAGEEDEDTLLDLRLEKTFRIAGLGLGLIGEVFNVFDDRLYSGYSGLIPFNTTNPNFGKPTNVVFGSGRRFQYGVRLTF